jgi:hypothetical protein
LHNFNTGTFYRTMAPSTLERSTEHRNTQHTEIANLCAPAAGNFHYYTPPYRHAIPVGSRWLREVFVSDRRAKHVERLDLGTPELLQDVATPIGVPATACEPGKLTRLRNVNDDVHV